MNLNYIALLLIALIPFCTGLLWYHPNSKILKISNIEVANPLELGLGKIGLLLLLSIALVYGYMNLIIHQLGFYELFFTDIMLGDESAKNIVDKFLNQYGDKHRHFGHGVLHGMINAFTFALPFITSIAILDKKGYTYALHHFSYWLITSMIMGGLISEFV